MHSGSYQHSPISSHLRGPRSISSQSGQPLNPQNQQNISPSGNYSDDILRQSEEQQSIYRDPGVSGIPDYEVEDYNISNPRKRVHIDGPENPKKRAAVAVSSKLTFPHPSLWPPSPPQNV